MLDIAIKKQYDEWLKQQLPQDLYEDLDQFRGKSDCEEEIFDRFYRDLEFGTAGLRGILGAGTNRMNIYTVSRASAAFAEFLISKNSKASVAIAYDSRINSDIFAKVTARVMAENGVKVFLWPELMPTPALSYAIRYYGCDGGIVITASHNPSQYNGYKAYDSTGCQLGSSDADAVFELMRKKPVFSADTRYSFAQGLNDGMIEMIPDSVREAFIEDASAWSMGEGLDKSVRIAYTPLYGAGLRCVTEIFRKNGFTNIETVKEQAEPDGKFPTCPYPNPEIREAMEVGLSVAAEKNADILIATDPDADRIGIAVKNKAGDDYVLLSGNQTGMLLLDYLCKRKKETGSMPDRPIAVKSLVSTDLIYSIAGKYGVEVRDVMTGFKNIAPIVTNLVNAGEGDRYVFGFEESYGYLLGTHVRDKDAVSASLIIAEMFAYYKMNGKSFLDILDEIYAEFGYYVNKTLSYSFPGASGFRKMNDIMEGFRQNPPESFAGIKVLEVQDFKNGYKDLGSGNVLKYVLEGHGTVILRPSGTEPKLKLYVGVGGTGMEEAERLIDRMVQEVNIAGR